MLATANDSSRNYHKANAVRGRRRGALRVCCRVLRICPFADDCKSAPPRGHELGPAQRPTTKSSGKEILQLQRAGISTDSAELLLSRMHINIDALLRRAEKARAGAAVQIKSPRRPELVMREPPKWYDANAKDNPPWIDALANVRTLACRQRWCYQHVQAIIVAIDRERAR
jgi:hypothetical protein